MRVLVAGSGHWPDTELLRHLLRAYYTGPEDVLVCAADVRGVAGQAQLVWEEWGGTVERHSLDAPALRGLTPKARRERRAALMVASRIDVALIFLYRVSRDSSLCARLALQSGITTLVHRIPEHGHRLSALGA